MVKQKIINTQEKQRHIPSRFCLLSTSAYNYLLNPVNMVVDRWGGVRYKLMKTKRRAEKKSISEGSGRARD